MGGAEGLVKTVLGMTGALIAGFFLGLTIHRYFGYPGLLILLAVLFLYLLSGDESTSGGDGRHQDQLPQRRSQNQQVRPRHRPRNEGYRGHLPNGHPHERLDLDVGGIDEYQR